MIEPTLRGKRALVTGAGSGIGRAVALAFAAAGAGVGLVGRRREALEETAAEIVRLGGLALVAPADVGDEAQIRAAVATCSAALGGLDTIAGVAGIELYGQGDDRVDRLSLEIWDRTIRANLTGMFLTAKYGVRELLAAGGGSIILTGSPTAIKGHAFGEFAYSASKAGVHGMVRLLAAELAAEKIRVNAVIPGFVDTPLNAPVMADPAALAEAERTIPMRRAGRPDEIAPIYVWLASDAASYATGAFFTIDGGQTGA